jgi:hypothetical protein
VGAALRAQMSNLLPRCVRGPCFAARFDCCEAVMICRLQDVGGEAMPQHLCHLEKA